MSEEKQLRNVKSFCLKHFIVRVRCIPLKIPSGINNDQNGQQKANWFTSILSDLTGLVAKLVVLPTRSRVVGLRPNRDQHLYA